MTGVGIIILCSYFLGKADGIALLAGPQLMVPGIVLLGISLALWIAQIFFFQKESSNNQMPNLDPPQSPATPGQPGDRGE